MIMPIMGLFSLRSLRNYFLMKKSQLRVKQICPQAFPDTVLCDRCGYNYISTPPAIEPPGAQWLELPNWNSESREFDSHPELGIFSQLSGVRNLLLPNYTKCYNQGCSQIPSQALIKRKCTVYTR